MKDSKEQQKLNQIKLSFCSTFCSKKHCRRCRFGGLFWYTYSFRDLLRIHEKGEKDA